MRILLVDDDTSVIQSLLATVKTLPGHEVRAATSGGKALENAATLGGIDLLITDVVMEPMDGFALRDEMKTRYPALRTILMSGYDLSDYAEQMNGCAFLQKPFEPAAVLAILEKELAPPAPKPVAVPVAKPRVAAVPMPTAVARESGRIVPQARAAVPKATAVAQPKAVAPKAVAAVRAVPAAVPAPVALPIPMLDTKPGEFTGHTIGNYEVKNQIGGDEWGATYIAVQTAIDRQVSLHVLSAERAEDEASRLRFIADARAKAIVQHPSILAVYEVGDSEGRIFLRARTRRWPDPHTARGARAEDQREDDDPHSQSDRGWNRVSEFQPHFAPSAGRIERAARRRRAAAAGESRRANRRPAAE